MNKDYQTELYAAIGEVLTARMKSKQLTVSQVARRSGNQFNTVKYVLEGKPFYFHQAIWIRDYLGYSTDELIEKATKRVLKGTFNGKEEKENRIEESKSLQSFI
ncbi:MAG: hypothetical protein Unbinned1322contig1000_35 [Prokaryotic dsDNA virus sp.]|nr:hypothetical protein [Aequorivita sp.]QDP57291.1 MAG: hypothetical protein Unbinned1322contig1000_35 [Prokaryotic dsDNA virus sp.]|tara:strand:+ start:16994 stop:17305 length:312 start_codon:yes stop_codon:yes gene_type:complete